MFKLDFVIRSYANKYFYTEALHIYWSEISTFPELGKIPYGTDLRKRKSVIFYVM